MAWPSQYKKFACPRAGASSVRRFSGDTTGSRENNLHSVRNRWRGSSVTSHSIRRGCRRLSESSAWERDHCFGAQAGETVRQITDRVFGLLVRTPINIPTFHIGKDRIRPELQSVRGDKVSLPVVNGGERLFEVLAVLQEGEAELLPVAGAGRLPGLLPRLGEHRKEDRGEDDEQFDQRKRGAFRGHEARCTREEGPGGVRDAVLSRRGSGGGRGRAGDCTCFTRSFCFATPASSAGRVPHHGQCPASSEVRIPNRVSLAPFGDATRSVICIACPPRLSRGSLAVALTQGV